MASLQDLVSAVQARTLLAHFFIWNVTEKDVNVTPLPNDTTLFRTDDWVHA